MELSEKEIMEKAEEAFRTCLSKVPFIKIEDIKKNLNRDSISPNFLIKLILPDGIYEMVVEVRNNGQPRFAREAVNQLLRYRETFPDAYGVFVAPFISSKAAEICSYEGIGYIDLTGNCYLCFRQVYIKQEGKPNPFAEKRDLRSLYSPKAERVLRVILSNPKKVWKIKDLSITADVSIGQVSNVKKLLGDREWIKTDPDGFSLNEPEQLISEWAENYRYRRNYVRDCYSFNSTSGVEAELAEICTKKGLKYAFTGFSGAARLAPAVRYQRAMVYIEESKEDITSILGLKDVPSGANVCILTPYDEGVFYGNNEIDGTRIASPIQIYLDLLSFRGRGEEASEKLLKEIILPQW